jgi:Zn2+/Cd2+-exporting ATPase
MKETLPAREERSLLRAEGMDCPSCADTVTRGLLDLDGVTEVAPDVVGQQVRVTYRPDRVSPAEVRRALIELGYDPGPEAEDGAPGVPADEEPAPARRRLPRVRPHLLLGGLFWSGTIVAALLSDVTALVAGLAAATVATAGWSVFPRAFAAARRGLQDMHVLMAVAALGALIIGEYVEAGAVLFLFAVAQDLERRTLERARTEVRSLMDLAPVEATVLRHGHQVRVPVDAVRVGETVLVRPGERIPVDGTVASGMSGVDASAITGESLPETRLPGDPVYAGSVNREASLEVLCERPAEDSAISRILRSIERARARKSPTEAFVDRFARVYTPLVLLGALLVAVVPPLLGVGPWAEWGYRALVLVVIACPCALVISTPVTVVSALTGAARVGILIKSGVHLETLGRTRIVALDKTGTLTQGTPRVEAVVPWGETDADTLLAMSAAAESRSEHPIARAVMARSEAEGIELPQRVEVRAMPGRGAEARVDSRRVVVGSPRLFRELDLLGNGEEDLRRTEGLGGTAVLVAWGEPGREELRVRGALLLSDPLRGDAPALIQGLRGAGVRTIVCLSGDRQSAVERVSADLDASGSPLDEWMGDLLPDEKVAWIHTLREEHGPILMVGDGVNDAPALAAADVGVAMGREGTDVAIDAADVALMEDELERLPVAFRLGRKAARIIRANIGFALATKLAFVLLGAGGMATLWMAVVADMGASLAVILNGLRTLRA